MVSEVVWSTDTVRRIAQAKNIGALTLYQTYYFLLKTQDEVEGNWSDLSNKATYFLQVISPQTITELDRDQRCSTQAFMGCSVKRIQRQLWQLPSQVLNIGSNCFRG